MLAGALLERGELVGPRRVRRDLERAGIALADERGVDEAVADVDVGEQAVVDVAQLAVEDEPDRLAVDQLVVELGRLGPVALDGLARLDRLRSVDADVADVVGAAVEGDLDRVAVDYANDLRRDRPARRPAAAPPAGRRPRLATVLAVAAGEQQIDEQGEQRHGAGDSAPASRNHRPRPALFAARSAATGCGGRSRA